MAIRSDRDEKSHDDYHVGWICALPCEMAAAICMLDEQHPQLSLPEIDHNNYTFGRMGYHNVVIACLPSGVMGSTSAAWVVDGMRSTFRKLRFGLLVGIGGGAPSEENDIRLGDVVVSRPEGAFGGVIQYDYGKTMQEGRFVQIGSLNRPPNILLNAMAKLQATYQLEGTRIPEIIRASLARYPRREVVSRYPGQDSDQLFHWEYDHPKPKDWSSSLPKQNASCDDCDKSYLVRRSASQTSEPNVHYGLVASGNQVIRDGKTRERLRREKGILCFEMEAAGIMDEFPCLVIRGISDYADSHKNKNWQNYAATTAAAYGSELLSLVPASETYTEKGFKSFSTSIPRRFPGGTDREYRDDQDEAIMQSLAFGGMFSRRHNIERRHPLTCEWIVEHDLFVKWIHQRYGLLWVKGIPGAGKSTLMSFLYEYLQHHTQSNTIRLDFFFNARGTTLQKQFLGLLRSMIYQLFKIDESVRPRIRRLFLEKMPEAYNDIQNIVWQQPELESLFGEIVGISAQSRDVLVFIDALDEAGPDFARRIALYFHRLNEAITSQEGGAKFCISSRHYPIVTTIPGTEITVEDCNRADITRFIYENLPLSYLIGPDADDLRIWKILQNDLVIKASGSFQWARLVIPLVEKQITDGQSALQIYNTLQAVPEALHEAYSYVLEHVISGKDRGSSLLLFQWVCLAQRPLSVTELRWAIAASNFVSGKSRNRPDQLKDFVNSHDQMERQVRALSGGLLRCVGKDAESRVEPIHQSVSDFIMAGGLNILSTNSESTAKFHSLNMIERGHAMIFRSCLSYIAMDGLDIILQDAKKLSNVEQRLIDIENRKVAVMPKDHQRRTYRSELDFGDDYEMESAIDDHVAATTSWFDQDWKRISTTCNDVFNRWPGLKKFQPTTPRLATRDFASIPKLENPRKRTYTDDKPIVEVNVGDAQDIKQQALKSLRKITFAGGELVVTANLIDTQAPFLWYALSNLFAHAEKLPTDYFMSNTDVIKDFESTLDSWRLGQKILSNSSNDNDHPNSGTTLLHIAAAANVTVLARYCFKKGNNASVNSMDAGGNTALHLAIARRHLEMVNILLEEKPDVLIRNKDSQSPLTTAFRIFYDPVACSIINYCAKNPLHMSELERMLGVAALRGSETVVKLLVSAGVNVNARGVNALYKAAKYGHVWIVCLLLEAGANINTKADAYGGALQIACSFGRAAVVDVLLQRKADIHEGELRTALSRARFGGREDIITILGRFGVTQMG